MILYWKCYLIQTGVHSAFYIVQPNYISESSNYLPSPSMPIELETPTTKVMLNEAETANYRRQEEKTQEF